MARLTSKKEEWFSIPGDADGAKLKIVHLKPGDIEKIDTDTSRWVGKRGDNDNFVSELEYNPQLKLRKLRMAAVVDWEGFYDNYDNKMKFSQKNLDEYMDHDPKLGLDPETEKPKQLGEWIDYFREQLASSIASEEEQEKN